MAGVWSELFRQDFTSVDSIVVTHNLDLEYLATRVIIGDEFRPDLIEKVIVSAADPTNELTIDLVSSQSGVVQILEADTYSVGVSPNTRQYQSLTHGQAYTYAESLGASSNSTNAPQQKVRITTPSVDAGDYLISWNFTFNSSVIAGRFNAQIDQDEGTILWSMKERGSGVASGIEEPRSGFAQVTLTAGIHTFDMDFTTLAGGEGQIKQARLEFWSVT